MNPAMPRAELVPPSMDKGWSVQFFNVTPDIRNLVIGGVLNAASRTQAKPFLQGNFDGWMMVEFWTDDEDAILAGAERIAADAGLVIS